MDWLDRLEWSNHLFQDREITYLSLEGICFLRGTGIKANFWDIESGAQYWISGCKKDGLDSLYANVVEIDEDVREEYWVKMRTKPEFKPMRCFKCLGKYSK